MVEIMAVSWSSWSSIVKSGARGLFPDMRHTTLAAFTWISTSSDWSPGAAFLFLAGFFGGWCIVEQLLGRFWWFLELVVPLLDQLLQGSGVGEAAVLLWLFASQELDDQLGGGSQLDELLLVRRLEQLLGNQDGALSLVADLDRRANFSHAWKLWWTWKASAGTVNGQMASANTMQFPTTWAEWHGHQVLISTCMEQQLPKHRSRNFINILSKTKQRISLNLKYILQNP